LGYNLHLKYPFSRAGGVAQVVEHLPRKPRVQTPGLPKNSLFLNAETTYYGCGKLMGTASELILHWTDIDACL
jgi:hypothetical protein